MQPTTEPIIPVQPELPTEFFAQAWARFFNKPMPAFFKILIAIFGSAGTILAGLLYYQNALTTAGMSIPDWLTLLITVLKGFLAVSGIITAKLTIQTPSTPALGNPDPPKPANVNNTLIAITADLQRQIEEMKAAQAVTAAQLSPMLPITETPVQP